MNKLLIIIIEMAKPLFIHLTQLNEIEKKMKTNPNRFNERKKQG